MCPGGSSQPSSWVPCLHSPRVAGVSVGWSWNYGPTRDGNNTISHNNISTIGMGETSDMGCVYHLGQDRGTTIHGNLCSNVSSFDYGGLGYCSSVFDNSCLRCPPTSAGDLSPSGITWIRRHSL